MREGGLGAPERHPIDWQHPDFTDPEKLDAELRRVFDICHGCRRCFNLCDSFPRLFDLIDESETGELDSVDSKDFAPVIEACTLCDMCFMVSCPYVPPHEFDLDFPHLMLRARAADLKAGKGDRWTSELTKTDRNGRLAGMAPGLANWGSARDNGMTRPLLESVAGVHREAELPKYYAPTYEKQAQGEQPNVAADAPAKERKAVLYATCFVNYNNPGVGAAARAVLARNGVETEVAYPGCCGMPQLERGDFASVTEKALSVSKALLAWVDKGYDIVALTPSCALMLKFEWPLILPDDPTIKRLSEATKDITEYVVAIAKAEGLAEGMKPLEGGVALHMACHARAQNIGAKAAEMLRLVPESDIKVVNRCSGHGGSWGVMKDNFDVAVKFGRSTARQMSEGDKAYIASECPLAGKHILQGIEKLDPARAEALGRCHHPIELMARAYGLVD